MGDGMSDSDAVREARAEERERIRQKTEKIKRICLAIGGLDREIAEHDAQINGKRTERDRLQSELEHLVGSRF